MRRIPPDLVLRVPPNVPSTSGGKDTLIIFASQIFSLIAGLATQSALAWTLGPGDRGAYAVCLLFGAILGVVFTFGSDRAAQYFVMAKTMSLSRGASVGIISALCGSVFAIVAGACLMHAPIGFFQQADGKAFRISLLLIPLTVLITTFQLQLAAMRRFARLAFFTVVQAMSNLVLILALAGVCRLGIDGALVAQVVTLVLVSALLARDLQRCGFSLMLPALKDFADVFSYGIRYYAARIGNLIDSSLGVFIVATFATRMDVGFFSVASTLVLKVLVFADSIETALLPRIAEDPSSRLDLVAQCIRLSALFTALAVAVIVAFSVPLVHILLSAKFLPAVPLLWILAPGVVIYGASQILMAYFRGIKRPGICSFVIWVGLIANALALAILYPRIGLSAAAWATTIGFACRSVVLFGAYKHVSGAQVLDMMRFRRDDFGRVRILLAELFAKLFCVRNEKA